MITLVYGGSGSGKSAFAEDLVCKTNYKNRYYLATMQAFDDESKKRIQRHRNLRSGKGFVTLEYPIDIVNTISEIDGDSSESIVLLECMSNLVANEMFKDGQIRSADECVAKIIEEVKTIDKIVASFVIVTNNIFEDGNSYDPQTKEYMRALGEVNVKLAQMAKETYEVVVGIGIKK